MIVLLWVLQILLAMAFFAHGCLLLFPPAAILREIATVMPDWFRLRLGLAEVLAAIGLTIPGIMRIQPDLISWAAGRADDRDGGGHSAAQHVQRNQLRDYHRAAVRTTHLRCVFQRTVRPDRAARRS